LTLIPSSTLNPDLFDSGSLSGKLPASGSFSITYTFTLTTTGLVSPGVIITSAGGAGFLPSGTEFSFYSGVAASLLEQAPLSITGSTAKVTLATLTEPAGVYSVVLTGTSNGDLSVGGTVSTSSTVPEPSTWAMMLLGFMGLGYAAFRQSGKGKLAAAAV